MAFTYFFRDLQTLTVLVDHVLKRKGRGERTLIWDAGCAMGQEPYSLAMLLHDRMEAEEFQTVKILATDIDESNQFDKIIKNGSYHESLVRRIPEGFLEKYFKPDPEVESHYQLNEEIRNCVQYRKHNLLTLISPGKEFDVILCKNVLLHFNETQRTDVIKMFHKSLAEGGYLALEQTQKLPNEVRHLFEQVASNVQLFQKIDVKE